MESDILILAQAPPPTGESTPFADFFPLAEAPEPQIEVTQIEEPQIDEPQLAVDAAIDSPPAAIPYATIQASLEEQSPPPGDDHFRASLVAAEISGVLALIANEFFASRDARRQHDRQSERRSEQRSGRLPPDEPSSNRKPTMQKHEDLFTSTSDHEPPRPTATIIPFPARKR